MLFILTIHTCIYAYTYIWTLHTCSYIRMHICLRVHTCAYMHTHNTDMYAHLCRDAYICAPPCMCLCACMHIYVHTYMHLCVYVQMCPENDITKYLAICVFYGFFIHTHTYIYMYLFSSENVYISILLVKQRRERERTCKNVSSSSGLLPKCLEQPGLHQTKGPKHLNHHSLSPKMYS